jgi:transposase InsO family protein
MARIYCDHVWKDFGLPKVVISDQGTQFVGHFMGDLLKLLGMKSNTSTAYYPQTDGQTKHVNQNIEQYLRVFTNFLQDDWADWLTLAEFNHNDQVSMTVGFSPFFVTMGFHRRKGTEPRLEVLTEDATKFATQISKVREEAGAAMRAVQETMKRFYDAK